MTLPVVPDPFYWTDESWGPALRCRAIDPLAAHLFTTRTLQLSSGSDWTTLARAVGASAVVTLTQVHGNRAVVIRRGEPAPAARPDGDVLVSDNPDLAIAVRAADCVPLLMADARTGAVAAVHAGWRGTAAGAARVAVETMGTAFGVEPEDVTVAIGPSIGACCYEVGSELVDAFAAAGHDRLLLDRWFQVRPSGGSSADRRHPTLPASGTRLRLDVAGANRDQLVLAGVREERIHMANLCTAMHLEVLTSFRAEQERAGRLAGVIRARW
jgi:YfiH family protein